MTTYRFLEPLDLLYLRGNKLFGDPGSFGESLIPPWPSAAAGALRSRMLAIDGLDLDAFAAGRVEHPQLGTPAQPGPFAVTDFRLARRRAGGAIEALHAQPADLVLTRDDGGNLMVARLTPQALAPGLACSASLPGLFPDGWRLPGVDTDGRWRLGDIGARLVCAAVPRAEVVSGWDLASWQPKPAQRAAPTGSVYWLEDLAADADQLRKLAAHGLWSANDDNPRRRAEGFNRVAGRNREERVCNAIAPSWRASPRSWPRMGVGKTCSGRPSSTRSIGSASAPRPPSVTDRWSRTPAPGRSERPHGGRRGSERRNGPHWRK